MSDQSPLHQGDININDGYAVPATSVQPAFVIHLGKVKGNSKTKGYRMYRAMIKSQSNVYRKENSHKRKREIANHVIHSLKCQGAIFCCRSPGDHAKSNCDINCKCWQEASEETTRIKVMQALSEKEKNRALYNQNDKHQYSPTPISEFQPTVEFDEEDVSMLRKVSSLFDYSGDEEEETADTRTNCHNGQERTAIVSVSNKSYSCLNIFGHFRGTRGNI